MGTAIGWTHMPGYKGETWNPIRGCEWVSEECDGCYAADAAAGPTLGGPGRAYEGLAVLPEGRPAEWTGEVRFAEDQLGKPLRWRAPRCIFAPSMSDLFHEAVTDEQRDRVLAVMALSPQHRFLTLTKRAHRLRRYLLGQNREDRIAGAALREGRRVPGCAPGCQIACGMVKARIPLPNVRVGVSAGTQAWADKRLPHLVAVAEAGWATMVSFEPLLERIRLPRAFLALGPRTWAILGGESADRLGRWREMPLDGARYLADQCAEAGVPVFVKQDSGRVAGRQGRIPDDLWALKQFPPWAER